MFKRFFSFIKKPTVILSTLLIIAAIGFAYYYVQYHNVTRNPAADAQKNTDKVVAEISRLMIITDPTGAVLATITDKSKLAGQKFFDVSQNGDDLVLFPAMSKAVLYRPSVDKIIDVGPFTPNAPQASSTPSTSGSSVSATPVPSTSTPKSK